MTRAWGAGALVACLVVVAACGRLPALGAAARSVVGSGAASSGAASSGAASSGAASSGVASSGATSSSAASPVAAATAQANATGAPAAAPPVLVALVEATKAAGTLARLATNGTHDTWRAADGVGLTLDRGVLFATRGLGADLYTAQTAPVLDAWPAGTYRRTLRHLDGQNRVVATVLGCRLTDQGTADVAVGGQTMALRHAVETCTATGSADIRNDYWRDADGVMRQSRQWVSPALGHVTLQQVGG